MRTFGGNSGYVGYSKSRRAVDAEERGLRSKSQMTNVFANAVSEIVGKKVTLREIKDALQYIHADEWHHTSKYGNKTDYYSVETIANYFSDTDTETETETESERIERIKRQLAKFKEVQANLGK